MSVEGRIPGGRPAGGEKTFPFERGVATGRGTELSPCSFSSSAAEVMGR